MEKSCVLRCYVLHIEKKASLAERAQTQGCRDEDSCNNWCLCII
uniref:Uncharacterized protein n=1 Tax=Rhizophora mucronata TaxID=61149 RepID=A0A2P2PI31_RHIMU